MKPDLDYLAQSEKWHKLNELNPGPRTSAEFRVVANTTMAACGPILVHFLYQKVSLQFVQRHLLVDKRY